jgi:ACS family hexuronate transporter-like MFS transporter
VTYGVERHPTPVRIGLVVAVATLAMTVSYVDRQAMAALGPTVKRALFLDNTEWGALTSAFSLAYLVGAPVSGVLVDRIGARRGLMYAVLAWSAVAALHSLAAGFATLFLLRVTLGFAEAPSFPSAARCVTALAPARSRPLALGFLFTGSSIGAALAGPAAIWLEARWGFRAAFLFIALVGLLYVPTFWAVTRRPDVRERIERREPQQARPDLWAVLREPAVLRACVLVLASAPVIMLVINWLPQMLESDLHVPQRAQARYVWIPPLSFDLGAVAFGALGSLRDARRIARGERGHAGKGDLVAVAALLQALGAFASRTHDAAVAVGFCSAAMAGGGALYAVLTADMLSRVELARAGAAGGLTAAAQSLAHIIAAPLVGAALDRTHSYRVVLVVLSSLGLPGALIWMAWPQRSSAERDRRASSAKR